MMVLVYYKIINTFLTSSKIRLPNFLTFDLLKPFPIILRELPEVWFFPITSEEESLRLQVCFLVFFFVFVEIRVGVDKTVSNAKTQAENLLIN